MACRPFGVKPLPETILGCYQLDPQEKWMTGSRSKKNMNWQGPSHFVWGLFLFLWIVMPPKFEWIFYCFLTENKDAGHNINCSFNFCQKDHEIQWSMSPGSNCYGYSLGTLLCRHVAAPHLLVPHPPMCSPLWCHNGRDGVSNHQPCLLNRSFWRRSKKTSKLRVTGLCAGNSPVTGEFPAQKMASNTENVSIWWRHHVSENWQRDMIPG